MGMFLIKNWGFSCIFVRVSLWLLSAAVCVCCCAVLCHFFSVPSLSHFMLPCAGYYSQELWKSWPCALKHLTLSQSCPLSHPPLLLVEKSRAGSPHSRVHTQIHSRWIRLQGPACMTAPLTADRLFGLLSVIVASVYFPPLLSPPVLSSLSFSPPVTQSLGCHLLL